MARALVIPAMHHWDVPEVTLYVSKVTARVTSLKSSCASGTPAVSRLDVVTFEQVLVVFTFELALHYF